MSRAGFAVVAEEVRLLAQRSAEAARMTSEKLAISSETTMNGVRHAARAALAFEGMAAQATELAGHAQEIASVSQAQLLGLEGINRSTLELDGAVRSNTSKSEETASAATSLHSHVQTMAVTIRDLQGSDEAQPPKGVRRLKGAPDTVPPGRGAQPYKTYFNSEELASRKN